MNYRKSQKIPILIALSGLSLLFAVRPAQAANPPMGVFEEKCNVVYGPTTTAPTVVAQDNDYPSFVSFYIDGRELSGNDESTYKSISESDGGHTRTFRSAVWDVAQLAPGAHKVEALIRDRDGNSAKASSACGADYLTIIVDREPPSVTIETPINGFSTSSKTIEVTGAVSASGLNTKSVSVNGVTAKLSDGKYSAIISMPDSGNMLKVSVTAVDEGGNTSPAQTVTVYRSSQASAISASATPTPSQSPVVTPSESPTPITLTKNSNSSPLLPYALIFALIALIVATGWIWRMKLKKPDAIAPTLPKQPEEDKAP